LRIPFGEPPALLRTAPSHGAPTPTSHGKATVELRLSPDDVSGVAPNSARDMSALWASRRLEYSASPAVAEQKPPSAREARDGCAGERRDRSSGVAFACVIAAAAFFVLAVLQGQANSAVPGGYSFDGGTPRERATVRNALAASSFDWDTMTGHVTVHIKAGGSYAEKGEVWLNPALLAHGLGAWGVIQHEFAHQVDFFLLNARIRRRLTKLLGAKVWWSDTPRFRHDQLGAERFASTLAWAYWPSRSNSIFLFAHAEATAMPAPRFRHVMDALLTSR
jgi:hypothetical protein